VNWRPWLDFQFHRLTLSSGHSLCVNRAGDLMTLVSGKLSHQAVTVEDSSSDGTSRIRVEFENGQFVKADPPATVVFIGGG
jgi:hypothetical protein